MKKKFWVGKFEQNLLYCFCISICALNLTACDDNDENGTQGNGPAPIGIPSSIIRRCTRHFHVGRWRNLQWRRNHQRSGSRWKHSCFQLLPLSRAIKVDPIRSLISITSSERESERWIASDFAFNTSGFVTAYKLKYTDTDPDLEKKWI